MKKARVWCFIMALFLLGTVVGCGRPQESKKDGKVELKWVYLGTTGQKDTQLVWDYFNERLRDYLPDTSVDFEVIDASDYAEKWKLKAAAREKIDIAWTGYTNIYTDEIANGSYMELDALLDEYGQELKAELPDWVWTKAKVNGKIYSVPNYQMMNAMRPGLYIDDDVVKQCLTDEMAQKMKETNYAHTTITAEDYALIEELLRMSKEKGVLKDGVDPSVANLGHYKGYELLLYQSLPFGIRKDDPEMKFVNIYEEDSIKLTYATMRDWYEKGYINKGIASATSQSLDVILGLSSYYDIEIPSPNPEKTPDLSIPYEKDFYISASQSSTSTVIPTTSENPERAMQLINLMNIPKGAELLNIISYGIEGTHYEKVSDNIIDVSMAYEGDQARYSANAWVFGNIFNAYETNSGAPGWNDYLKNDVNKNATVSPIVGFKPDLSSITSEVSQVLAVQSEYELQLKQGILANWKERYEEMLEKMRTAGSERIIKEIQRQIDQYRKDNGI